MSTGLEGINSMYSNTYNNSVNNSVSNSTTNALENTLTNSDLSNASEDQLMSVCKDFEEYFVEQMVKSMVKMANISGEEDANDYSSIFGLSSGSDSGMSTLSGFYGDKMVTNISKSLCESNGGKGLGLAQTLYQQMKRNYGITDSTGSTENAGSTGSSNNSGSTGNTEGTESTDSTNNTENTEKQSVL